MLLMPFRRNSPISRVVSAYYYCVKTNPRDQLCADFHMKRAENKNFMGFVRHWGNYGLMQFVPAFLALEDMTAQENWASLSEDTVCISTNERGTKVFDTTRPRFCPGWYRLKLFVESRRMRDAQGNQSPCASTMAPLNQLWMHRFLQPAMRLLSEAYTAVGILEQWDASMQLFQSSLKLPNMNWRGAFGNTGKTKVNLHFHDAEQETLRRAWHDPGVRELLWLDILLYDHAVSVFKKQAAEYGIDLG